MGPVKKFLLATVALSAFAGSAIAADLPVRRAPPAPAFVAVPVFTWTGFYVGGNAGYGFAGGGDVSTVGAFPAAQTLITAGVVPGSSKLTPEGFVGGGQIGYNWQFGSVVLGAEADIQYTDLAQTKSATSTPFNVYSSYRTTTDYIGTVRGRVGYAWDRWMLYATGGLAYGDVYNRHFVGPVGGAPVFAGSKDGMKTGYTVGAGVEYALPTTSWLGSAATVKIEYLYYDLGNRTVAAASPTIGPVFNSRFQNDGHIVRAGLNWKFGGF